MIEKGRMVNGGREGEKGGREGWKEGGREGEREGRSGEKERGREEWREGEREGGIKRSYGRELT